MTIDNYISLGSAVVSFLSFLGTIYFAKKAKDSEKRANDIVIGQSETALRVAISNARQRIEESTYKIVELSQGKKPDKLTANEKRKLEALEKALSAVVEDYLNAYEDACGKYIDNKIDKDRFKKFYIKEIENLCKPEVELYAIHMHPRETSKYEAIWKAYREWHRHEK